MKINRSTAELRSAIESLLFVWKTEGIPSREVLLFQAAELKENSGGGGLWSPAPKMLTATIDDGIGQGIELIGRFAQAAGVKVVFLGLLQSPERICREARKIEADLLGLTVLQLDSEPILADICRRLSPRTEIVAGGPAFLTDPHLAARVGVSFVARDVAVFMRFLLGYSPGGMLTKF